MPDQHRPEAAPAREPAADEELMQAPTLASLDEVQRLWGRTCEQDAPVHATLKRETDATFSITSSISLQRHSLVVTGEQARPGMHRLAAPGENADGNKRKTPPDYEILGVLGKGAIGVVYHARQTCIDRTTAVKMLNPERARDERTRAKFMAEAAVTGRLDHPNIVPVYELAEDEEGKLFYVMKNVQGYAWSDRIGELTEEENLEILLRVCDAVAFAHAHKVIHRDLKPENIMLGDFGEVMVMDWGLAVPTDEHGKGVELERYGALAGTPAYMAPEMAAGDAENIGVTSDVYLLGAILYEIATGRRPHAGDDLKTCLFNAARNVIVPTDAGGELVDIARKAMATHPRDRFPSVREFQEALREYRRHLDSLRLCERARGYLEAARRSRDYHDFARALITFREAGAAWEGNRAVGEGAAEAAAAYAACACDRGDLDLAQSLLSPGEPRHRELRARVLRLQAQKLRREQRRTTLKIGVGLLLLGTLVILGFSIYSLQQRAREEARKYREEAMARVRRNLRANVDIAYAVVAGNLRRAADPAYLRARYGFRLRSIIQVAREWPRYYAAEAAAGRLDPARARRLALERIRSIRYNSGSGYIWINDMSRPFPRMVMHPILPALDGKVLNDAKYNCALGRKVNLFCAFRDVCARQGSGFVDYVWPKPTHHGLVPDAPKLSYVELFKPWGWILGTGVYVDDARRDAIEKSKRDLESMRFNNGTGYFWINDMSRPFPRMVMHPILPALDGKVLNDAKYNCALGRKVNLFCAARDICARQGSGFVDYVWPKPTPGGVSRPQPKLSYVRLYRPLGWVIGSGTYTDDIERAVARRVAGMQAEVKRMIKRLLAVALGIVALVALAAVAIEARGRKRGAAPPA